MKKYAPDKPDSQFHRPGDLAYLRELIAAAGLSQRAAGPLLGMDERAMRYKVAGERAFTYPEQFCLEVLADANKLRGDDMQTHDVERTEKVDMYAKPYEPKTQWFEMVARPFKNGDVGKIVVGTDRFGAPIHGTLVRDGFGLTIKAADGIDVHNTPIAKVSLYTLINPPKN
jgi:hypothetical protein